MRRGRARFDVRGRTARSAASAWGLWAELHAECGVWPLRAEALGPGWLGYVGFEAAGQLERLPKPPADCIGLPTVRLGLFPCVVVLDHTRQTATMVVAPELAARFELGDVDWRGEWNTACAARGEPAPVSGRVVHAMERGRYEAMIRRALAYIGAGDTYQVNLAQRIAVEVDAGAVDVYRRVRAANPAAYGALLTWADGAVLSFSPELFLRVRDGEVLTQPIKGTRPLTQDAARDAALRRELLASAKDAAELAMIVDLHRNDLGRVCRPGSIRVVTPRRVELQATVQHTVADIVGMLREDADALALLRACFPAGSISGAPKIRALEIIAELEPDARGVYTGSVCHLGLDGQMTANVAIRTVQMRGGMGHLFVGGGIVADSTPAAEYAETIAKARGILRGLGVEDAEAAPDAVVVRNGCALAAVVRLGACDAECGSRVGVDQRANRAGGGRAGERVRRRLSARHRVV